MAIIVPPALASTLKGSATSMQAMYWMQQNPSACLMQWVYLIKEQDFHIEHVSLTGSFRYS